MMIEIVEAMPNLNGMDQQAGLHRSERGRSLARFQEFDDQWGQRYPAITGIWRPAWTEFVPTNRTNLGQQ